MSSGHKTASHTDKQQGAMLDWKRYIRPGKGTPLALEPAGDPMETLREAVRCYASLLEAVADHAPDRPKQLKEDYGHHLRKIRDELTGGSVTVQTLHDIDKRAQAQLKGYGNGLEKHVDQHGRDAREVMSIVAAMAESIASQETQYNVRFKGIAKKLRLLTTTEDIADIRQRLSEELGQLEKYAEDMTRDTRAALNRVNADLLVIRYRHSAKPWLERESDPVTQLPGRPACRDAIETRQRVSATFSIARFAVHDYALPVERQRQGEMTAVLTEFAARFQVEMKQAVSLCRWSEAEFVAVIDSRLPEVADRLSEVEHKLTGTYSTYTGQSVTIRCVASAIQPFRGETVDQLIVRLESASLAPAAR